MSIAVFKKYEDGFYSFLFEDGVEINFEEIHPKALYKYNLKEDESYVDQSFKLKFSEVFDERITNSIIYRIDSLVLL